MNYKYISEFDFKIKNPLYYLKEEIMRYTMMVKFPMTIPTDFSSSLEDLTRQLGLIVQYRVKPIKKTESLL